MNMNNGWKEQAWKGGQLIKRKRTREDRGSSDTAMETDRESGSSLDQLTQLMTTFFENANKVGNSSATPRASNEVVPLFDPEDKNQSVSKWLNKIEELREIYDWDERTTILHATTRLRGLANTWYQSLPTLEFTWGEWKIKFQRAFPEETDYDQQLEEMLRRTKRREESMIRYYYEKLSLLNNCEIFGKKAVACIIGGIPDMTIKTAAKVKDFDNPENLLKFLKTVTAEKPKNIIALRKETPQFRTNYTTPKRKCYGCGKRDHLLPQCPDKIRNKERGAIPKENNKPTRHVLTIEETGKRGEKYFKNACINGMSVGVYVDFGASCNVMREELLKTLKLKHNSCKEYIKGYGGKTVETVGIVRDVAVRVDQAEAKTNFLIVPDNSQKIPAIIGQPFTEQDNIIVYKDSNNLHILNKENIPYDLDPIQNKIKVYLEKVTVIPPKHSANVICNAKENGALYIDSSLRLKENNEYFIPRCIVECDQDGKCVLPLINITDNEITIQPKHVFARAVKCGKDAEYILSLGSDKDRCINEKFQKLNIGNDLTQEQINELIELLKSYQKCFSTSLSELGCTTAAELKIDLVDDKAVVYKPYRMNPSSREKLQEIVGDLLKNNIIRESNSPFSSPVILVKKKNGEQRLCIDYRMLNGKIKQDHFPLPRIDDQLDYLQGHKYFTSLDMTSGYYQIPVAESSKYKTSFVTPDGQYEFNRMPFGISTAPAVFQRMINKILGPLRGTAAIAYLDDILIPSKTFEQGKERLSKILNVVKENCLTLNPQKCNFFSSNVTYLGFEIDKDGMKPGLEKCKSIANFNVPKNVHQVRQFLGLTGFFRQFVKNYAEIARPLTTLTKKDKKWSWGSEEETAFKTLKERLTQRPVLSIYNPKAQTEVHTDASKLGVAGILLQKGEDDKLHAVAYYSRHTTKCEENYHSYELETLAIVETLKKFRVYLLDIQFKVVTDCNSIKMAAKKRDLVPRIARWWLLLQEFTFTIEYRPGSKLTHVDALSRNPIEENTPITQHEILHIETADWILANQLNDDKIKFIQEILKRAPNTEYEDKIHNEYKIEDGRIYKVTNSGLKWLVPKGMRNEVVRTAHDELGHFGLEKTLKKLSESYWFPQMQKYVERYIRSCIPCLYTKQPKGKVEGLLNPIEKQPIPFHTVHMDHLGPFEQSTSGKKYVIVCVDAFTKYVILYAARDTKTLPVLNLLGQIIAIFGVPKRIITDQGTSYTSKAFKRFCEKHGIRHILTAVATPKANGQVERFNSTLLSSLKATVKEDNKWDQQLPMIQFAMNNTVHSVTQKTPSQILLGYTPISPGDASLHAMVSKQENTIANIDDVRKEVMERINQSQAKQKLQFDKSRKPGKKYSVGDVVLVRKNTISEGQSRKLADKYKGPFQISKILPNDRYIVTELPGSYRTRRAPYQNVESVEHIKPWIPKDGKSDSEDGDDTS